MLSLIDSGVEQMLPGEVHELVAQILDNYDAKDFGRLLIMADWFHEHEESELEYALRWMVKHGRYPLRWDTDRRSRFRYDGWPEVFEMVSYANKDNYASEPGMLPGYFGGQSSRHKTFLGALAWLADFLSNFRKHLEVQGM
jgi:hypothetical protein